MARACRVRAPDRRIAELPVHRIDPQGASRTVCGQVLAQTVPEPWEQVPQADRCPRCASTD